MTEHIEPISEKRRDFAEYGCGGVGEYGRCQEMSEDYERLLAENERLRAKVARVEALAEAAIREAFLRIAIDEVLTISSLNPDEVMVPPHWRDRAIELGALSVGLLVTALADKEARDV